MSFSLFTSSVSIDSNSYSKINWEDYLIFLVDCSLFGCCKRIFSVIRHVYHGTVNEQVFIIPTYLNRRRS